MFLVFCLQEINMNLYDMGNGVYGIKHESGSKPITGSLRDMAELARALGVDLDEFELAVLTMNRQGHTRANFGIHGTFIFSSEK